MAKRKPLEAPSWFFMWSTGKPYITMICGWRKGDVIAMVEKENGCAFDKIRKQGGRVIRCRVVPTSTTGVQK